MGNLYFKSSRGEERLVKANIEKESAIKEIKAYVHQLNPEFKIYYIRSWESEPGVTTYDLGSWSEFFKYKEEQ